MKKIFNILLSLSFGIVLILPAMDARYSLDRTDAINEKRELVSKPMLSMQDIRSYPDKFEAYYNDHFGFRNLLIRTHGYLMYDIFNETGNDQVLSGKKGWLYFTNNWLFEDYEGRIPYSPKQLMDFKSELEQKRDLLASRGCRYVFVIAPNKATIYPENLPARIVKISDVNRVSQLVSYMKEHSTVCVLDLRETLLQAKNENQVYHRLDSHWNDFGAIAASGEIASELSRYDLSVDALDSEGYRFRREVSPRTWRAADKSGNLEYMFYVASRQVFSANIDNEYGDLMADHFDEARIDLDRKSLELLAPRQRSSLRIPPLHYDSDRLIVAIDLSTKRSGTLSFFFKNDTRSDKKELTQPYIPGRETYFFEVESSKSMQWSLIQLGVGEYSVHSVEIRQAIDGAYRYSPQQRTTGDLAILAGLDDVVEREEYTEITYSSPGFTFVDYDLPSSIAIPEKKRKQSRPMSAVNENAKYRTVITGDSFGRASFHLIAPLFGRSMFIQIRPNLVDIREIAKTEHPEIFIEERVERLVGIPHPARTRTQ